MLGFGDGTERLFATKLSVVDSCASGANMRDHLSCVSAIIYSYVAIHVCELFGVSCRFVALVFSAGFRG